MHFNVPIVLCNHRYKHNSYITLQLYYNVVYMFIMCYNALLRQASQKVVPVLLFIAGLLKNCDDIHVFVSIPCIV